MKYETTSIKSIETRIIESQRAALEQYGVHGTPTFVINEKVFKGEQSFEQLERIIENNLANH